ncbi:MAG: pyridoxal phosphate-dependent aminotransferase [Bacteroidetes bacterium]|nr:pyridoxal phosphate-dependent aminotransferase [Bacteroidota bacterium]
MLYRRMPIEVESPEQLGYDSIRNNLSESSYTDAFFRDIELDSADPNHPGAFNLRDLVLCYGDHAGHPGLRQLIVDDTSLKKDDVLLTIGAAGALFIIATTLLEKGDELIVVRPNYATNIETPLAIGAAIKYIDLQFEEGFQLDIEKVKAALTPKTRYISVTHPHNPTGVCLSAEEQRSLINIAEQHGIYLLVDETYRDMVFGEQLPIAATHSERIISVSSLSKTYGLPGLRTGWLICRDQKLMEQFLAAKEQIHICGPVIDEELSFRYLLHRDKYYDRIRKDIKEKFTITKNWMERQTHFEWVEPQGGCVCFPRTKDKHTLDYKLLLEKYGTYVGPGHWFDMPDHYMRIGFGWPTKERLEEGLAALENCLIAR